MEFNYAHLAKYFILSHSQEGDGGGVICRLFSTVGWNLFGGFIPCDRFCVDMAGSYKPRRE